MPPLLDDANRRTFERYRLMARRVRAGAMKGDRRSSKRGSSLEFADYRPYTTGDDLRRLDWKVYARTERAVVKLFDDEEDLAVHLWVDTSASMGFPTEGNPDHHKLTYAKRLAAALACIALNENDSLTLTVGGLSRTFRGRARLGEVLQHLTHAEANGQTDLDRALSDYAKNRQHRAGLLFVLSDLFSPASGVEGVRALRAVGHEIVVLHVLSPDELEPPLVGDLRLMDAETGLAQEVSLDDSLRELYRQRLAAWREQIAQDCKRHEAAVVLADTRQPYDRLLVTELSRLGVLR